MALSTKDIQYFAFYAVRADATPSYMATNERKAQLLAESRRNACALYAKAQDDVAASGFRVTERIKDILWATLEDISNKERGV